MVASNEIKESEIQVPVNNNLTFKEKLRNYLKKGINKESEKILEIQKSIQSPFLTNIMKIATFTGNDDFYTIFIPMLFWCDVSEYGLMRKELFKQLNFLSRSLVNIYI